MLSAFTFRFPVPFSNPFSAQRQVESSGEQSNAENHQPATQLGPRLSPVPSTDRRDLKRPRAWEPSAQGNSLASTTFAQTGGYLDTPAKYRDLAAPSDEYSLADMRQSDSSDLPEPPSKRRRGLAGSIVSTAVSAALIGSAVGLTVYRLWRDKGKEPPLEIAPPPPPYEDEESWKRSQQSPSDTQIAVTPPTPHSRPRRNRTVPTPGGSQSRRRRRVRNHASVGASPSVHPNSPPSQPEFQFGMQVDSNGEETDEQMDALSSKLSYLIEQGRKALGAQVVVQSEAQEDEVDDGDENWVDEDEPASSSSTQKRRRRKNGVEGAPSLSGRSTPGRSLPPSPHIPQFSFGKPIAPMAIPNPSPHSQSHHPHAESTYHSPRFPVSSSLPAGASPSTSIKENPGDWSSDAIRESMERARARALAARQRQ